MFENFKYLLYLGFISDLDIRISILLFYAKIQQFKPQSIPTIVFLNRSWERFGFCN